MLRSDFLDLSASFFNLILIQTGKCRFFAFGPIPALTEIWLPIFLTGQYAELLINFHVKFHLVSSPKPRKGLTLNSHFFQESSVQALPTPALPLAFGSFPKPSSDFPDSRSEF